MTNLTIILTLAVAVGIYFFAKQRGERKKAKQVMDREAELDRKESEDELAKKRNADAWDNLNDTIDSKR